MSGELEESKRQSCISSFPYSRTNLPLYAFRPVPVRNVIFTYLLMHIYGELCNRISVPRLANLMFVSLVGPSLQEFQPLSYVKQWLLGGHRAACDNKSKKCVREIIVHCSLP
jgi:hypothetical protein